MSDKTKEIIVKTNIIVAGILTCIFFVMPFLLSVKFGESFIENHQITEEAENVLIGWIVTWLISVGSMVVLMSKGWLKLKPVKAEQMKLTLRDYYELEEYLTKKASENDYEESERVFFSNGAVQSHMFIKEKLELGQLNNSICCLLLVKTEELHEKSLDALEERFIPFLQEYYGQEDIYDIIRFIMIICVDRTTNVFDKYVNSNIYQSYKLWWLPVGVSFSDQTVYIAKQRVGISSEYIKS